MNCFDIVFGSLFLFVARRDATGDDVSVGKLASSLYTAHHEFHRSMASLQEILCSSCLKKAGWTGLNGFSPGIRFECFKHQIPAQTAWSSYIVTLRAHGTL